MTCRRIFFSTQSWTYPKQRLECPSFLPAAGDPQGVSALSLLLARAMIAAAKADGQIDVQESQAILNQI
ncbi:MAG: DUF533 domain-containing protein, partial [Gammaproteobacteria bacterium]|nr:DUF533 domain-containing protein [Gammaproteobacteria bacterium]